MRSSIPSRASALLTAAALLAAGPARAARTDVEPRPLDRNDASAERQSRALFQAGRTAYETGRFEEAMKSYSAAYALKPLPAFLFNIAQCARQLRDLDRAAFLYGRFIDLAPDDPNAPLARELLAETEVEQRRVQLAQQSLVAMHLQVELARARADAARAEEKALSRRHRMLELERELVKTDAVSPSAERPLYTRWWLWTGVGAVALGAAAAVAVSSSGAPSPTLGTVSAR